MCSELTRRRSLVQAPGSQRILAASLGTLGDEVPGQTGSGKKFHRNVISGADFTADVRHIPRVLEVMPREWESLNAKAELARMHRDGHCLEAVMLYVHHLLEWVKTLKLFESKADPRWKRATEGRRPKNRSWMGVHSYLPGWQPKEKEA